MDWLRTAGRMRRAGRIAGGALVLLSILFVAWQGFLVHDRLVVLLRDPLVIGTIASLSAGYAIALTLLATAWAVLVAGPHARNDAAAFLKLYSLSNIGKYLPGNVFHYGLRQIYADRVSASQGKAVMATVSEQLLQFPVVALLALVMAGVAADTAGGVLLAAVVAVATLLLIFVPALLRKVSRVFPHLARLQWPGAKRLLTAAVLQAAFFGMVCLIVVGAYQILAADASRDLWAPVAGLYLWCWLGGFVVPGAPGGVGVREALITALLGPVVGNDVAVSLGLATRLITVLGDGVFALLGALAGRFVENRKFRRAPSSEPG